MQSPETSKTRKPWYQKAVEMTTLWKVIFKSPTTTNSTLWRTINSTEIQAPLSNPNNTKQKLRKCTSLKVATTFTRVCLCAPISSYNEVFNGDLLPPRRSYSYPRSTSNNNNINKPFPPSHHPHPAPLTTQLEVIRVHSGRHSIDERKVFRGKSLTDDVLMKRFVLEEEEQMMQIRRKNQMEIIRRRASIMRRKKKLGPSRLSRMVLAEEDENEDDYQECMI